jgi:hypothetical protein
MPREFDPLAFFRPPTFSLEQMNREYWQSIDRNAMDTINMIQHRLMLEKLCSLPSKSETLSESNYEKACKTLEQAMGDDYEYLWLDKDGKTIFRY